MRSDSETSFLIGAFFYTYAVGQIAGGYLSDRYGTRLMLSLYLLIWSILTGVTGLATGFFVLVMLRFGCGLFEAGAYPACAGLIRRWFPYERRGLASGLGRAQQPQQAGASRALRDRDRAGDRTHPAV